jgi:tRNA pseudouridine synthase 10
MDTGNRDILEQAMDLIRELPICDRCLGRQFAWLSTDSTNEARGASLKLVMSMTADAALKGRDNEESKTTLQSLAENGMFTPAKSVCQKHGFELQDSDPCALCSMYGASVYERIPTIIEGVLERTKPVEFDSFLVGSNAGEALDDKNDEIRGKLELLYAETLKSDFNRELGKRLSEVLQKEVDLLKPDLVVFYDMVKDEAKIRINPVFIYGRYRKLTRGIPQSRWDCKDCGGKGCDKCQGTGRKYQDSISEYVGVPAQEALKGSKFKFHAAGREDIDVLMLGTGRPFVVEISEPLVRRPDLAAIAQIINTKGQGKVEVSNLELATRQKLQNLKTEASESIKEYQALIFTGAEVSLQDIEKAVTILTGCILEQRTPTRVVHRRSDLVRKKQVLGLTLVKKETHLLEGYFRVQGGTYIKELISGDEGRTSPSLAEILGTDCKCQQLDVIAVYSE